MTATRSLIKDALSRLGIKDFVLSIHDASFPALSDDDTGRGTPYSAGAQDFLGAMAELGFTGLLLGPQGQTSLDNPSPYDATVFSKNMLSVDLRALVERGLLPKTALREARVTSPDRVDHAQVWQRYEHYLARAHHRFVEQGGSAAFNAFVGRAAPWLMPDAIYDALMTREGGRDFTTWPRAWQTYHADLAGLVPPRALARYAFVQWLLHEQHAAFMQRMHARGWTVLGDLQVGVSRRDLWRYAAAFLPTHWMGAPPSRTNPLGQPWGYPVLDPAQYDGAAGAFLRARLRKLLGEFDGLRIDHPHGLVCPWAYARVAPSPLYAVQHGARLLSSPDVPELARYAIAREDQLNFEVPRYADDFVTWLDDDQVTRYAVLMDVIAAELSRRDKPMSGLLCEVLSTQPYELGRVLSRFGLGRFRVTQKAVVQNRQDVYRADNAQPADWVMVGNHDTPPLPRVLERYVTFGELTIQARYLASRLTPAGESEEAFAYRLVNAPKELLQAKLAELFLGPAEHVLLFWGDLFGLREIYNRPGEVHPDNWTLRLPSDWRRMFRHNLSRGDALSVPRALAMAVRARGVGEELAQALDAASDAR